MAPSKRTLTTRGMTRDMWPAVDEIDETHQPIVEQSSVRLSCVVGQPLDASSRRSAAAEAREPMRLKNTGICLIILHLVRYATPRSRFCFAPQGFWNAVLCVLAYIGPSPGAERQNLLDEGLLRRLGLPAAACRLRDAGSQSAMARGGLGLAAAGRDQEPGWRLATLRV